jgi:pimeloyl-ACP methyl ester carboxylesterase
MVISRVEAKAVTRLVYLCAFMPGEGQSLVGTGDGKPAPFIQLLDGGLMQPDPARAGDLFYSDCDPATKDWARGKIRAQSAATVLEPVAHPLWRRVPSTYVICANDMTMSPDIQRNVFAPRASEVIELQASHSPFLSQPQAVAELLAVRAGAPAR